MAVAEPKYQYIADDLRAEIEAKRLQPGAQLRTEIELMEHYKASRNTVRDAIKLLTTRGLVETRPGQGTFVTEKINPFVSTLTGRPEAGGGEEAVYIAEVQATGRTPTASKPRIEIQDANEVIAEILRVDVGTQVISRHQQFFIDDTPWSLQTTFYPMELGLTKAPLLLGANDIEGGAVAYLARECGITQVGYRDSIAVRAPDPNEMNFFRLPSDGRIQVFEIFRTGFLAKGDRFRLTITVYPADRNRFRVNVGDVPSRSAGPSNDPAPQGVTG